MISRTSRARVALQAVNVDDPRRLQQTVERGVEQLQRGVGRFPLVYRKTADGAANTATTETLLLQNHEGFDRNVELITYTPVSRVDDSATNYATIRVYRRLVDGGDDSALAIGAAGRRRVAYPLAELSTRAKPWAPLTATKFTFTGESRLKAGELLTFDIAKFGAGVVVPDGLLTVWLVDA